MAIKLSSLSLFVATPEQVRESRRRTSSEWANGRSLEEYLLRDAYLEQQEHARNGRLITWVLAPRDTPASLDFLSSCETYRREGIVWRQASSDDGVASGPIPERVVCYGIASVFTPSSFRGKGYARHMMRLLHWVLADASRLPKAFPDEWGAPPARFPHAGEGRFSALWSDIGSNFYKGCGPTSDQEGWIVRDSLSTMWDVRREEQLVEEREPTNWTWLDMAGVSELWERDADDMIHAQGVPDNLGVSFTFLPNKGVAAFQHQRNIHILDRLVPSIQHWGVAVRPDSPAAIPDTYATWSFEVRPPEREPKTLMITRLKSRPETFEKLLEMVMIIAKRQGMDKIEVYNLPGELQPTATSLGGITSEREEHMPAFKWYGTEDLSQLAWLHNERFCWC
ncbi:hypothetical protein FPV67DRAFT_1475081 [Lyophyllum atratum]|nr:hypothetical protein FPV67DRAFT_1475081 [Lyophyllum atratum]